MIVASVHDPEIFSPENMAHNRGYIYDRLSFMMHGHLLVVDDAGVMGRAMYEHLAASDQEIANALLRPDRLIRLPIDVNRRGKISQ